MAFIDRQWGGGGRPFRRHQKAWSFLFYLFLLRSLTRNIWFGKYDDTYWVQIQKEVISELKRENKLAYFAA